MIIIILRRLLSASIKRERKGKFGAARNRRRAGARHDQCAAHVEFIGPRLGEIGARPGGNRPRISKWHNGMDMLYAYYQILREEKTGSAADRNLAAA